MAPIHTGSWGQTLVEALQKQGFSNTAIAGNTGINLRALEGDEPKIGFGELALLFERAAEVTNDDLIGFETGQSSDFRRLGLIAYTGVSAPTVRRLLKNLARYQQVIGDALAIDVDKLDAEGELCWRYQVHSKVARKQFVEFGGSMIVNALRVQTNRQLTPQKVEFRHFRKTNIKAMSRYFGCPVEFGAGRNCITLRQIDLDLPLRNADDGLFRILSRVSEDTLKKLGGKKPALISDIEERIAQDLTKSQTEVANEIGMSRRTLDRRLSDAGTSFFTIVQTYREAMAKNMLTDTDLPLTEIAFVLGYSDPGSFSTAFRRWTGKTPSQYREQVLS